MLEEIWKDVVGFENYFRVSSAGQIYGKRSGKILIQTISKTGYYTLATRIGGRKGKTHCFKVHRLVAEAFIPNPTNKLMINHKDGNKLNNDIRNLEWCTHKENVIHAVELGLYEHSIENFHKWALVCRKLTNEDVRFIHNNYKKGCSENGARAYARKYNIAKQAILDIIRKHSYKDIQ